MMFVVSLPSKNKGQEPLCASNFAAPTGYCVHVTMETLSITRSGRNLTQAISSFLVGKHVISLLGVY
jgi:hypothetical protein